MNKCTPIKIAIIEKINLSLFFDRSVNKIINKVSTTLFVEWAEI